MKARPIDFDDVGGVDGAMRRIAIVRFAELLALAPALRRGRPDELHALRIACKRLRYALERFSNFEPALHAASVRLAQLQDTLGNVHDRDVLLAALPGGARNTLHRIRTQRDETVARSRALLHD
ncbi:MAG: CHAD domain-containing protein, partial [Candidatus Baltobacteraceae bacterium]